MPREIDTRRITTTDLTPEERDRVTAAAEREHLSRSQWVAKAIREALKRKRLRA